MTPPVLSFGSRWVCGSFGRRVPALGFALIFLGPLPAAQDSPKREGGDPRSKLSVGRETEHESSSAGPLANPILRGLAREIRAIRERARWLGWIRLRRGREMHPALHLGRGIVATPFLPDAEQGRGATYYFDHGRMRLSVLGSDRPFVTFLRMKDATHLQGLPAPIGMDEATPPPDRGDLALVLGPRGRTRLVFLSAGRRLRFRPPPGGPRGRMSGRGGANRPSRSGIHEGRRPAYGLRDAESAPGSMVLTCDGTLLGMLVRPQRHLFRRGKPSSGGGRNEERGRGEGEYESASKEGGSRRISPRNREDFALVLDAHMLRERGLRLAASFPPEKDDLAIGVTVLEAEAYARWRARLRSSSRRNPASRRAGKGAGGSAAQKAEESPGEEGLVVLGLCRAGPAERAGLRVYDRLLRLDGVVLDRTTKLREVLARHRFGEVLDLQVLRGAERLLLKLRLD